MNDQSHVNEVAWNYRAYEHWTRATGTPAEYAAKLRQNINGNINERYVDLLTDVRGKRILNALGSNGRKAVPLCLLGAEVTIVDISEENQRYALELAKHAGVELRYELGDFATYENAAFEGYFDIAFSEGGILHYFNDLNGFFEKLSQYLRTGGTLIINDFHPFRKVLFPEIGTNGDYFETGLHAAPVAYQGQFGQDEQAAFPQCLLRFFRMGEIITAIGNNRLRILEMREMKQPGMENTPAEFTLVATKCE